MLPPTYPLSEDLLLLGLVPLAQFHSKVDFFKESSYQVDDEQTFQARKQVRWGRIREMIKKMADSNAFDFIQYNQTEQRYSVIDENAKRQQQGRFMKALATQRLMEQVSSLEKNVNRMTLNKKPAQEEPVKRDVYTCVVDVTVFLDGLNKVKRWASQTLNVDRRSQSSILEIIVPYDVIDALDDRKKGTSHMNMQVRESIRFLDQQLSNKTETTNTSFLRIQKMNEKIDSWDDAKAFWIGEESRSLVDQILSEEGDEEEDEDLSDAESDDSSDHDLFKRRRGGESDDSEEEILTSEEEESEEEEEAATEKEEFEYDEAFEEEEEVPYTYRDVPKAYRSIISCLLYYHSKQQVREENQPERLVLVTNDEDLAWWAELFGNPVTGKRLLIKTVNEWDQMVGKLDFEKVYDYSWKQR